MTRRSFAAFVAVVLTSVAVIGQARSRVSAWAQTVTLRSDVFVLPPARVLRPLSIGYFAAVADLAWAHVLVTQGLMASEGRPFDHLEHYMEAVTELDPKFREPYRLAGSLFVFQQNDPNPDSSARIARRLMEKGLKQLPNDAHLWMDYGEFLAYVGPQSLREEDEKRQWKVDGARALVRAGELGSTDNNVLWHSISAVSILSKEGERDAMLRFLERIYSMTEDEELRRFLEHRIRLLESRRRESQQLMLTKAFEDMWRHTTPFSSRTQRRIMGPHVQVWQCSGPMRASEAGCSRNWPDWARRVGGSDRDPH